MMLDENVRKPANTGILRGAATGAAYKIKSAHAFLE